MWRSSGVQVAIEGLNLANYPKSPETDLAFVIARLSLIAECITRCVIKQLICKVLESSSLLLATLSPFNADKSRTHPYSHVCPLIITTQQRSPYIYPCPAPTLSLATFHYKNTYSSYTLLYSFGSKLIIIIENLISCNKLNHIVLKVTH